MNSHGDHTPCTHYFFGPMELFTATALSYCQSTWPAVPSILCGWSGMQDIFFGFQRFLLLVVLSRSQLVTLSGGPNFSISTGSPPDQVFLQACPTLDTSWLAPRTAFLSIHPATTAFPLGLPPTPAFLLACPQHGIPWVCPQHWCCLSGSPPAWCPLRLPQLSISPGLPPEWHHLSVWLATRLQVMWTCILSCLGLVFSCCRLMQAMQWGMYQMTLYPG